MKVSKLVLGLFLMVCGTTEAQNISLPQPDTTGGIPLMQAIAKRQSERNFTNKTSSLSNMQLSSLLWATCGYSHDDKRTVPSAMNKQEMSAYVITAQAVFRYDPKENCLVYIASGDHRHACANQEFARKAMLNIALVYDSALQPKESYAAMTLGAMSQNIYLWCASHGYKTVVRASFDADALKSILKLKKTEKVLFVQTVGD